MIKRIDFNLVLRAYYYELMSLCYKKLYLSLIIIYCYSKNDYWLLLIIMREKRSWVIIRHSAVQLRCRNHLIRNSIFQCPIFNGLFITKLLYTYSNNPMTFQTKIEL